ncbi:putative transporter [Lachnellula suecica]|uniref:Putative transporter n=1 Tax=Lachnellula suecica TaxID=602035 RepID=A0A8T9C9K4_9HELO|nr:putative transporter [Lachnellula suecica]
MEDIEKKVAPRSAPEISSDEGRTFELNGRLPEKGHLDVGFDLFQQSHQYDPAQLELDAVKVRKKLDFILLPMMMMTYMLSFLDKQTLNYSNAYGLQADTHMTGDDYSWVSSALYFGWLAGAYPWNVALQRFPIGKMMGGMLLVWGVVCMLQATVFNFSGFFAVRFFLGLVEACISPAWVLLTSMFWTREEQPLRTSFWLSVNGVSSIIGALLSYGLGHVDNLALPNWKLIYLVVGAMTIVWGVVILLYLPDGPHNAKILTEYERVVAIWRISKNQTGIKDPKILPHQITEALLDPKTYLLILMAACYGILNGGVANFISALIKGLGFDALRTSLLQTPGGAFELIMVIAFGYLSTYKNMLGVTIILGCIPGIAGLAGLMTIGLEHQYSLVACCWLQNILGSPIVLSWTLPALNVAGHTKRTTVLGLYFVVYCAGNIAGPHLFLTPEAPRYPSAIKGLLVAYCVAAGLQVAYTGLCYFDNKKRDRQGLRHDSEQEALEGFEDLTDKENLHFRYKL